MSLLPFRNTGGLFNVAELFPQHIAAILRSLRSRVAAMMWPLISGTCVTWVLELLFSVHGIVFPLSTNKILYSSIQSSNNAASCSRGLNGDWNYLSCGVRFLLLRSNFPRRQSEGVFYDVEVGGASPDVSSSTFSVAFQHPLTIAANVIIVRIISASGVVAVSHWQLSIVCWRWNMLVVFSLHPLRWRRCCNCNIPAFISQREEVAISVFLF